MKKEFYFKKTRSKLALLAHASGASSAYIAWRLNVTPSCISGILSGKQNPSDELLERLATFFDVRTASPKSLLEPVSSEHFSKAVEAYLGIS